MDLLTIRNLFDAAGNVLEINAEVKPESAETGRANTSLTLSVLMTLWEAALPELRANAISATAKLGNASKFPAEWQLFAVLKEIRTAWYKDDFSTLRDLFRTCWWAVREAEKIAQDLGE